MLFRGTTSRPTGFVEREVEGVGGSMNAGTSWDYTYYYVTLPPSRLAQGLELLADISMNAALDAAVLDKEKEVVLEEMRLGEDHPRRVLARRSTRSSSKASLRSADHRHAALIRTSRGRRWRRSTVSTTRPKVLPSWSWVRSPPSVLTTALRATFGRRAWG